MMGKGNAMKRYVGILLSALLLAGCAKDNEGIIEAAAIQPPTAQTVEAVQAQIDRTLAADDLFSSRDLDGSYDGSKAKSIVLDGQSILIDQEGVYLLSGVMTDGQIVVDAGKDAKVQLVLDGVDVTCASSAAIYCKSADKLFVTLAPGSENRLANGGSYTAIDENNIDAVIFSKADLTLQGQGSLSIAAQAGHGIVSKDELVITGGSYVIAAVEHGMTGKDGISISGGVLEIHAGEDGIHAKSDKEEKGFLYIGGGSFQITAGEDAVSATGAVQIEDGIFRLESGGGSEAVTMRPSDAAGFRQNTTVAYGSETSAKGIKSDSTILISGGSFALDCADDGIHAGSDICIAGGEFTIRTADDGIHSDANVQIQNGTLEILYCYEGIEGENVTIDSGEMIIDAVDDGINAAGGMDGSGFGGQRMGGNWVITVNGGTITIVSDGDCLDSNGSLILNGGKLDLTCGGNGNTALDCDGSFQNNGAEVSTNDGSENGGGFGSHGGFGSRPEMPNGEMPSREIPGDRMPNGGQVPNGGKNFGSRPDGQGRKMFG